MTTHRIAPAPKIATRVDYLDWLRVLALLGVFVFHTFRPFDTGDWHVKNAEQSEPLSVVLVIFSLWGLPFFFLVAGAATHLALQWRTGSLYLRERVMRLLVPLAVGWALLGPVQLYLEDHSHGWWNDSLAGDAARFFGDPLAAPPLFLARLYHLWFVVFLLEFCVVGLPLFLWLHRPHGRSFTTWLGGLGERRGGILLLALPVAVVTVLGGSDMVEEEHGWGQWAYMFVFFLLGHLVMTDSRLTRAVQRDLWPGVALGAGGVAGLVALDLPGWIETWDGSLSPRAVTMASLIALQAWGWVVAAWSLGMRARRLQRPLPRPVADAAMPFFVVHQPVILAVAFVVVAWDAGIPVKWLLIAVPSLLLCVALAWGLSRVPVVRRLLGVKPRVRAT
jgi:peptidoglycan/LPS O-acetylase OafA/YrhL